MTILGTDLAYQAVHSPLQAPDRYVAMCDAEGVREPQRRVFCGMVKVLDEGIGNLSRRLRASPELMESTTVIFSTDKYVAAQRSQPHPTVEVAAACMPDSLTAFAWPLTQWRAE